MPWYAKPSGVISMESSEGQSNIKEINTYLNSEGFTLESQAAMIGNIMNEGTLNPWRWESDTVNYSMGYGLFQYTSAEQYFTEASGVPYYAPNRSTTVITPGAEPSDGYAQVYTFVHNILRKWNPPGWPSSWSSQAHPYDYSVYQKLTQEYGVIRTVEQYSKITDIEMACMAFLGYFEKPRSPNLAPRVSAANQAYQYLTGETPPMPIPSKKLKVWMMLKPRNINRRY